MTPTVTRIVRRSATAPTDFDAVRTVIRRELVTRFVNRSIVVSTLMLGALAGLGAGVGGWFLVDRFGSTGTLALDTQFLVATAMISALLAALIYSSQSLASGVVEEKSSRLVEILLTKIGVTPLLAGKLIGVGLVTLGQLLVIGGAALTSFTVVGGWSVLDIELGANLLWFLVWFLLGFCSFATLSTLLASMVSRHADLGTALTPLVVSQLVLWVVALYLVPQYLASTWIQVLSFVPLLSSYLMPMRFALDGVHTVEMVIAALIAAVTVPLLFRFTTTIYRKNALRTGSLVAMREPSTADETA
ncbi:hypothetical protein GCM10023190_14020 [Enteractinococcus fodinae]|uniref:ABC-2 type transport system permease protein n=1 Tax=Enteractinococcus fodinae TaxID=684663 RepID=A0ABU2AXP1_9MICC|nr:ABC transporter permease [Enteractinococcus fodinae]MDR7346122.1 ABC-2 type transport system permease protein [Enteractinococcus fodinae]